MYIKNCEDSIKKLWEIKKFFGKRTGYKINIQIFFLFLYTNNEVPERRQFHLQLQQKLKYLGINLTKEVKDLYSENCKRLMKGIEKDTHKMEKYSIGD